jgi:hypothetical protein
MVEWESTSTDSCPWFLEISVITALMHAPEPVWLDASVSIPREILLDV